jgi:hypothetical protein
MRSLHWTGLAASPKLAASSRRLQQVVPEVRRMFPDRLGRSLIDLRFKPLANGSIQPKI